MFNLLRSSFTDRPSSMSAKLIAVGLVTFVYAISYGLLFESFGFIGGVFSTFPVLTAAWMFGARGGLIAGAATFPLNSLLLVAYTDYGRAGDHLDSGIIGSGTEMLVGFAVGYVRDLRQRSQRQVVELESTQEALRLLNRELDEAREDERRAMAHTLHDEFGQELTGLLWMLESMSELSGRQAQVVTDQATEAVRALMDGVRQAALDLRPSLLDDLGLVPTLDWLTERLAAQHGLEVEFTHSGMDSRFNTEVETAVFRIAQEALTNVARHARTNRAWLTLSTSGDELSFEIEDRGTGFDVPAALSGPSFGLSGMQERAERLGGRLQIDSTLNEGTRLKATIPAAVTSVSSS